ncbi:MAG: hypothetical protein JWO79_5113 [Actinomycetia bacterium]|nr:hypothetical protein [Actinomycetes bacterium]
MLSFASAAYTAGKDLPHIHIALDDAIEQGALFCAMLAANPQKQRAE